MAPAGYTIRRATAADHTAVLRELAAYLAHIEEAVDFDGLDRDVAGWQEAYGGERGALLLVVGPSGDVMGTAGVRLLAPGVGEVKRMWIRPEHQGRGLGRPLMEACLAEARALGYRVLRLDSESRMAAAIHLYRAYGFTEIADYNGNHRANVWMERAL